MEHKPDHRKITIEKSYLYRADQEIETHLVNEVIIIQDKKRIEFLLALKNAISLEVLQQNNFRSVQSLPYKTFMSDEFVQNNLENLFLYNYKHEKRDSYLPQILEVKAVKSNYGRNIGKTKEELFK